MGTRTEPKRSAQGSHPLIDVDRVRAAAFTLADRHGPFASESHRHDKHQLLYAVRGTMHVVAADRRWILPPERAAWIPAGLPHEVTSRTGVELRTTYFARRAPVPRTLDACRVFAVSPLAREMLVYGARWAPEAPAHDATRVAFYRALLALVGEWAKEPAAETLCFLPRAESETVQRAMTWIDAHLDGARIDGAARAAHTSTRSLARAFERETGAGFRDYLQTARIMRALELLASPRRSVTEAAFAVGFKSLGAFTRAFRAHAGETPSAYRDRAKLRA